MSQPPPAAPRAADPLPAASTCGRCWRSPGTCSGGRWCTGPPRAPAPSASRDRGLRRGRARPGQPRPPRPGLAATRSCSAHPATSTSTSPTGCTGAPTWPAPPRTAQAVLLRARRARLRRRAHGCPAPASRPRDLARGLARLCQPSAWPAGPTAPRPGPVVAHRRPGSSPTTRRPGPPGRGHRRRRPAMARPGRPPQRLGRPPFRPRPPRRQAGQVSGTLLLTGVRPLGGLARDLLVADGKITGVGERPRRSPRARLWSTGEDSWPYPTGRRPRPPRQDPLGLPWRPHTAGEGLAALIDKSTVAGPSPPPRRRGPAGGQPAGCLRPPAPATSAATSTSTASPASTACTGSWRPATPSPAGSTWSWSPSPRAACWSAPGPPSCWRRPSAPAPTWSAASTRPASTSGRSSTWTPSSPSPAGTAAASTSTCTTAASWARSPST